MSSVKELLVNMTHIGSLLCFTPLFGGWNWCNAAQASLCERIQMAAELQTQGCYWSRWQEQVDVIYIAYFQHLNTSPCQPFFCVKTRYFLIETSSVALEIRNSSERLGLCCGLVTTFYALESWYPNETGVVLVFPPNHCAQTTTNFYRYPYNYNQCLYRYPSYTHVMITICVAVWTH